MQKGLSIMKRITTFFVLLALLFSLFSCSENTENGEHSVDAVSGEYNGSSEDSKSVFFGDIEVPVDAEYQILVSDTFNVGGDYVSISSQVPQVTDDETEAINNRRIAKYMDEHPPQNELRFELNDISETVSFSKVLLLDNIPIYFYKNEDVSTSCFAKSSSLRSFHIPNVWNPDAERVINSIEDAVEYALKFMRERMDVYKLDEYKPFFVSRGTYTSTNSYGYTLQFLRLYKGIFTSSIMVSINEQGYVSFWLLSADKDGLDFFDSCIDYATEVMSEDKALTALQNAANSKTEIASIRNVSLCSDSTNDTTGDDFQCFPLEKYGNIEHNYAVDKTAVSFYYSYTAVMKDGSEKQGCNVVSVFLPIDWAEVYGEKDTISHTNE